MSSGDLEELRELRAIIGFVDLLILDILKRRAFLVRSVIAVKRRAGLDVRDPAQEEVVFARLGQADGNYPVAVLRRVFEVLVAGSEDISEEAS